MIVNRESLLNQLELVQPGLSPREIVEQSSCFIFKDGLVQTYNDEIACRHTCLLSITGAVQAAPLMAILRKMVEEEINVEVGEGELLLQGKKRRAGIHMEMEILLPVDSVEQPTTWKTLNEDFGDAIQIVEQCAGKDESKFATTCIHVHPKYIEAFDNYQASRYKVKTGFASETLVRRDSLKHIITLGMIEFSETASWVHFKNANGLMLSCRRFIEDYPPLDKILNVTGTKTTLPKGLADAADKAQIFSSENADNDQVTVELRPGKLRVTGQGSSGWFSEVKQLTYDGAPISFLISPKLLMELTKRHNECEIAPGCLKVDGGKFVYVTCLGEVGEDDGNE